MTKVEDIIKLSKDLGWEIKSTEDNENYFYAKPTYIFRKKMNNGELLFSKIPSANNAKELLTKIVESYIHFDAELEALCWLDDDGLPTKETGYKNKSELDSAVEVFRNDLLELSIAVLNLHNK